jgi:F-type H+-transporting ATPase subunit c
MDIESAKVIGAGLATLGFVGPGIGIGLIWAALITAVGRNPGAAAAITTTAWVSFALVEALAIFALVIALIILFG